MVFLFLGKLHTYQIGLETPFSILLLNKDKRCHELEPIGYIVEYYCLRFSYNDLSF